LLNAQGGLWNIGPGVLLSESNLTGGSYIDDWKLSRTSRMVSSAGTHAVRRTTEEAAALNGYILSSGPKGVTIHQAAYREEAFRILPPTNARTWASFASLTSRYQSLNVAPAVSNLGNALSGPVWRATFSRLSDIHSTANGFRAILHLAQGSHESGLVPGLNSPHVPGVYVLTYDGAQNHWSVQAGSPPKLTVHVSIPSSAVEFFPIGLRVSIHNAGTEDWRGTVTLSVVGGIFGGKRSADVIDAREISVPGQHVRNFIARWAPEPAGRVAIHIHLTGQAPISQIVHIRLTGRPPLRTMIAGSISSKWVYAASLIIAFFVVGGTAVIWSWAYGRI
jgi:hypothetical protein